MRETSVRWNVCEMRNKEKEVHINLERQMFKIICAQRTATGGNKSTSQLINGSIHHGARRPACPQPSGKSPSRPFIRFEALFTVYTKLFVGVLLASSIHECPLQRHIENGVNIWDAS